MTKLQDLTAKVMSIVHPEAIYDDRYDQWCLSDDDGGYFVLPLTLSDVLIALRDKKIQVVLDQPGKFFICSHKKDVEWDLTKNLSQQKPKVISFLASTLL